MTNISKEYRIFEKLIKNLKDEYGTNDIDGFKLVCDFFIIKILNIKYKNNYSAKDKKTYNQLKKYYESELKNKIFMSDSTDVQDEAISNLEKNIDFIIHDLEIENIQELLGFILEKYINRKDTGSYYTEKDVSNYITKYSIFVSLFQNVSFLDKIIKSINAIITNHELYYGNQIVINKIDDVIYHNIDLDIILPFIFTDLDINELNELYKKLKRIKIIDPTCGSGSFIISSFDFLYYLYKLINIKKKLSASMIIKNIFVSLHGVDINPEAIALTKMRLIIKLLAINSEYIDINNLMDRNFIVANSLIGSDYIIKSNNGFNWRDFGYKFDCILGNPPYVESRNIELAKIENFKSIKCNNLYAYIVERALNISKKSTITSFILPLSFVSTKRMDKIRNLMIQGSEWMYLSHYADRPGSLFNGVHQRLTIVISKQNKRTSDCSIYSTSYNLWNKTDRRVLFENIKYYESGNSKNKIGNEIEDIVYKKINSYARFKKLEKNTNYSLYVSSRLGLWTKSFLFKQQSNEYFQLYFNNETDLHVANALINSTLFYLYWVITTDCWHVSKNDVISFLPNLQSLDKKVYGALVDLSKELVVDLEKNKVFINSKQVDYQYKHKLSKNIIDKIDDQLALIYNFDLDTLNYIKYFALKYRMNDEYKKYIGAKK